MDGVEKSIFRLRSGHFSVPAYYFQIPDLTIQEQMVLMVLHSYINPRGGDGETVNREKLAKDCRMTVGELNRTRERLTKKGLYVSSLDTLKLNDVIASNLEHAEWLDSDLEYVKYYAPFFNSQGLIKNADKLTADQAKEVRVAMERRFEEAFQSTITLAR